MNNELSIFQKLNLLCASSYVLFWGLTAVKEVFRSIFLYFIIYFFVILILIQYTVFNVKFLVPDRF